MCAPYGNSRKWVSAGYAEAERRKTEERRRRLNIAAAQKEAQQRHLSSAERQLQPNNTLHTPQNSGTLESSTLPALQNQNPSLYSPESRNSAADAEDQITMRKTSDEDRRRRTDLEAEKERYDRIHNDLLEMYGNPDGDVHPSLRYERKHKRRKVPNPWTTVPWTFEEWLVHQNEMAVIRVEKETRNIQKIERQIANPISANLYNGKRPEDTDRGLVLAEKTVWRPGHHDPERKGSSIWPSASAFDHEGDQREVRTAKGYNFRRFLPLVRQAIPGNDTIRFDLRRELPPYEFDKTWFPPEGPDIYFEREDIHESDVPYLLSQDLLHSIDHPD